MGCQQQQTTLSLSIMQKDMNGLTRIELNGVHYQDKCDMYVETMRHRTFLLQNVE